MNKKIIQITSFGYRYGPLTPPPTLSYDIRDIPNPPPEYRFLQQMSNDHDTLIRQWLMKNEVFKTRIEVVKKDVLDLVRRREIKDVVKGEEDWVTVGVNCLLGRHRSVTFVEELSKKVKEELGDDSSACWEVRVRHRELEKRI
ncbi:hypothetical protein AGABI1DRAFT_125943 [Agaricus bisporus var. burnettii JB137-S8]|uniref:RapZ C-terminal domain-containing protein n=1 Tax=Agaricus bisporus var. burnettii (strain JB137-S8 / ATCC MYA-4627 / FGSC 10392) TaxID=597362 RepID=K5XE22_AGABU|nr:uncharacterized protein AGABI1DRAFT_125943 [Agaricus bisporus var. burnettii JB137-S8]EKM81568.1 hypothetical protein AGABI1DRAFT_125943 [Agaricus bisporus var. burnettii JB137-S8]